MRRILSITAIFGLMASMASPWLMAASCPRMRQRMACCRHRKGHDHQCATMPMDHSQAETATPAPAAPFMREEPSPMKCPMSCCCGPQHPTSGLAAAPAPLVSLRMAQELACEFVPVVFTTNGFSSHTDRGPPTV